jgi:hypothetical protein
VDSGKHQRHLIGSAIDRHATESFDSTVFSFHHTESFAASVGKQNERCECIRLSMSLERGTQINVSDDLSVNDNKSFTFKE